MTGRRCCVELERLNYGRQTINVYLRSIRRLSQLMVSHGLALDQLTSIVTATRLRYASQAARHHALFVQLGIPA